MRLNGFILLFAALFLMMPHNHVHAQSSEGEVLDAPICFMLVNTAPYRVLAEIQTNFYTRADGIRDSHESTMRIQAAGSVNDAGERIDQRQICTAGPFFEGRKIRLTLKTIVPIFECKTAIDRGEVIIKGVVNDDNTTETTAECY